MWDQDNLNNLGRAAQLKAQEETRRELEKLRRQIGQEERMPHKCPWCAGGIESNVSKCRHCTSDIEWVNLVALEPCKPQDKESVITSQNQQRLRDEKKRRKANAEGNRIVECRKCHKEMKRKETFSRGGGFICKPCRKVEMRKDKAIGWFITVPLVVLGMWGLFYLLLFLLQG